MAGAPTGGFNVNAAAAGGIQQAGMGAAQGMNYRPMAITAPTQAGLQQYTNPYESQVVQQSLGDLERSRLMAQNVGGAQAGAANAFGGSRHGIAEAETNRAFADQAARTASGLRQTGYQNAQAMERQAQMQNQSAGLAGEQQRMAAGSQLGSLSNLGFGMGQTIQGRMDQQGAMQQALNQQLINAAKGQYAGYTGAPAQSLQYLLQAVGGAPASQQQSETYDAGLFDYLTLGAKAYAGFGGQIMGLLDNIGNKLSSMSDDDKRGMALGLASGFAGMSGNPNTASIMAGIEGQQAALQNRRDKQSELERSGLQNASMMASMRAAGIDDNLLAVAKNNPELLKSIMKSYADSKLNPTKEFAKKYSTPRIDQTTGKYFVIVSDPNKNTVEQIEVGGATGLTEQQKLTMDSDEVLRQQDIAKAQQVGQQAFGQMERMQGVVRELSTARRLIIEEGAKAGILQKYMPSFNAATSEFRAIANRLGIEVINSATFGALSETELALALETGFPRNLSGDELIKWIDGKIAAQTKMSQALYNKARSLTSGITYSSFIQNHGRKDDDKGENLTPAQKELKRRGLPY